MKVSKEYLRRNLSVAKAIGIRANTNKGLERLKAMKRPPLWMIDLLQGIYSRSEVLPKDLVDYRDLKSPYVRKQEDLK